MKRQILFLAAVLLATPAFCEEENPRKAEGGERWPEMRKGEKGKKHHRHNLSEEEKEQMRERRLEMMEKTLKDIGVTEEQQVQIMTVQTEMKEQMREAFLMVEAEKKKLSELEKSGASETEIFAAIDAVSAAQAEQMKILARNRIKMERILGKEKFDQFMDSARNKWQEHGRRGGGGMPPRPGLPPVPKSGADKDAKPPMPGDACPTP